MTEVLAKRVTLAAMDAVDINAIRQQVKWLNDPEVVRFSEQRHKFHTVESQVNYLTTMRSPNIYRTINLDGKIIGSVSAVVDEPNQVANLGILIGEKEHWGKRHGLDAWIQMVDYLFLHRNIRIVEAGCMANNYAMINIFRHSGMLCDGHRVGHFLFSGQPMSMEMWSIHRPTQ